MLEEGGWDIVQKHSIKKVKRKKKSISLKDLQFHIVQGCIQLAVVKQLFQASDYSRRTCGEMLTSVNTLAVLQVRLVFGKAGLEIAG